MKLNNGFRISVQKSYFNRTKVASDGVTHMVDTQNDYPMYTVEMCKCYFDIDKREECVDRLIADLESTILELKQMKEVSKSEHSR